MGENKKSISSRRLSFSRRQRQTCNRSVQQLHTNLASFAFNLLTLLEFKDDSDGQIWWLQWMGALQIWWCKIFSPNSIGTRRKYTQHIQLFWVFRWKIPISLILLSCSSVYDKLLIDSYYCINTRLHAFKQDAIDLEDPFRRCWWPYHSLKTFML